MASRIKSILGAYANRVQELEDALFGLLSSMTIEAATGDLETKIGKLIGEARGGRTDGDFRQAIRLRVRVNRSKGRAVDIIDVATLAAVNSTPRYGEPGPPGTCGFTVDIRNLPAPAQVANLLAKTKAIGTYGTLSYSADALTVGTYDDAVTTRSDATQLSDSVAGLPAVYYAGAAALV